MEELISLTDAARIAGYRSTSTLKTAAISGRLRTVQPSPKLRLTTRAWLEEYLANVKPRGIPRGGARDDEGAVPHRHQATERVTLSAQELIETRFRFSAIAEEWDAPAMDVYDAL